MDGALLTNPKFKANIIVEPLQTNCRNNELPETPIAAVR